MDTPCITKTLKRHLNNEKIKHEKRIHYPKLTMKHKEKRLEYARQYQTMSAKEWLKVVFSDENKFNLDGPGCFQKYWHAKYYPKENYLTRHSGGGSPVIWEVFLSSRKLKLQSVSGRQKAADYVKIPNNLSLTQEGRRLC